MGVCQVTIGEARMKVHAKHVVDLGSDRNLVAQARRSGVEASSQWERAHYVSLRTETNHTTNPDPSILDTSSS